VPGAAPAARLPRSADAPPVHAARWRGGGKPALPAGRDGRDHHRPGGRLCPRAWDASDGASSARRPRLGRAVRRDGGRSAGPWTSAPPAAVPVPGGEAPPRSSGRPRAPRCAGAAARSGR